MLPEISLQNRMGRTHLLRRSRTVKRLTLSTFCCHSNVTSSSQLLAASKKNVKFRIFQFFEERREEEKKEKINNCARLYCWITRAHSIDPLVDISQRTRG